MGIFSKKAPADSLSPNNVKSEATTVVPSENVSNTDFEKEKQTEPVVADKSSDSSSVSSIKKTEAQPVVADTTSLHSSKHEESEHEPENEKTIVEDETIKTTPDGEDEVIYPSGLKLAIITLALCLSIFLVALDNTIIATAIPTITNRFNSLGDVGWYGSAYLLTTCALQLFFGKSVSLQIPCLTVS